MSRRRQRAEGEARRRTGCWPCKDKHVRCTEEQPRCSRCQRLNLQCEYGIRLLWQEDAVQRGIFLGREGAWSKHGKPKPSKASRSPPVFFLPVTGNALFLHTTYDHFQGNEGEEEEVEEGEAVSDRSRDDSLPCLPSASGGEILSPALTPTSLLPSREAYLFNYFVSGICPSCSLSPTFNPYLRYIAPMTFLYPPLHNAIISVSANQLRLLSDRRFEREAWWYKNQALKGLQESIKAGAIGWPFVATVLMLCFYDISDGCNESWMTHLRGGLSVMNQVQTDCTESEMLRKFCLMYFVAHQIMGYTAGESNMGTGGYSWADDDQLDEIDPLMGCSRRLLDLINQISTLASNTANIVSARPLTSSELVGVATARASLERSLHTLEQRPPASTFDGATLTLIGEVKRFTALLYLHERLAALPLTSNPNTPSSPINVSPSYKATLISNLLALIEPLPATPTLLWPLFVLGNASLESEDHRRFVLERLNGMLKVRNLGSVRLARKVVEARYREWDLGFAADEGGSSKGQRATDVVVDDPPPPSSGPAACRAPGFGSKMAVSRGKWISLA